MRIVSFSATNPRHGCLGCTHFTDKDLRGQKGYVTQPGRHGARTQSLSGVRTSSYPSPHYSAAPILPISWDDSVAGSLGLGLKACDLHTQLLPLGRVASSRLQTLSSFF